MLTCFFFVVICKVVKATVPAQMRWGKIGIALTLQLLTDLLLGAESGAVRDAMSRTSAEQRSKRLTLLRQQRSKWREYSKGYRASQKDAHFKMLLEGLCNTVLRLLTDSLFNCIALIRILVTSKHFLCCYTFSIHMYMYMYMYLTNARERTFVPKQFQTSWMKFCVRNICSYLYLEWPSLWS